MILNKDKAGAKSENCTTVCMHTATSQPSTIQFGSRAGWKMEGRGRGVRVGGGGGGGGQTPSRKRDEAETGC